MEVDASERKGLRAIAALAAILLWGFVASQIGENLERSKICISAVSNPSIPVIKGTVSVIDSFNKSGYSYVVFNIAGHQVRSAGPDARIVGECGFRTSLHQNFKVKDGMKVSVKLVNGNTVAWLKTED